MAWFAFAFVSYGVSENGEDWKSMRSLESGIMVPSS